MRVGHAGSPASSAVLDPLHAPAKAAPSRPPAEWIDRGYLGWLPRLTQLAPDIVEKILDGR